MPGTDGYASALDDAATRRLAHALRAIFPHDGLSDAPYLRSADAIIRAVSGSARQTGVVIEGLRGLDALAGGDLTALDPDGLGAVLRHLTQTEFFQLLLTSAVVSLYSDPEVWEHLGYEGFSSDKGGYLTRGFDDIDWLPAPRTAEYDGADALVEYVPAVPGMQLSFDATKKVPTI